MESILFQVATWWGIGALGGVLEWTNRRVMAGFCVIVVLCGFTLTVVDAVVSRDGQRPSHFAAAKMGNEYHRVGSVCLRNVHDPVPFESERDAQDQGFGPCKRCIQHVYSVAEVHK